MRPNFPDHRKFKALVRKLHPLPEAHVLGLCYFLFNTCYASGDPVLGDSDDVEDAARWTGPKKKLTNALMACGGKDHPGLIERVPGLHASARYQIHDFLDHAPEYVYGRRAYELERKVEKLCDHCKRDFRSKRKSAKYCSHSCRQLAYNDRVDDNLTVTLTPKAPVSAPHTHTLAPAHAPDVSLFSPDVENKDTHPQPPQGGEEVVVWCDRWIAEFYRQMGLHLAAITPHDREAAELLIDHSDDAQALIGHLVQAIRKGWPDCTRFSGAMKSPHWAKALKALHTAQRRQRDRQAAEAAKATELSSEAQEREDHARLAAAWEELPDYTKAQIRRQIMDELPEAKNSQVFLQRLCLRELDTRIRRGMI